MEERMAGRGRGKISTVEWHADALVQIAKFHPSLPELGFFFDLVVTTHSWADDHDPTRLSSLYCLSM